MKATYIRQQATPASTIIQQAFAWMFGGLLVTAFSAVATAATPGLVQALVTNPVLFFGLIIAELGLVFGISASIARLAPSVAIGLFLLYAALNGVTMSLIFLAYTGDSIAAAFGSASLLFGVMSAYGYATKRDLSGIGSIAMMALIGLIIASVVNAFLHSNPLGYVLSFGAILIFTALTAYDTQKIRQMSETMEGGNLGIYGALRLYLDFINIFLSLLRIFGGNRN